jgi:hypothetical protein
VDTKGNVPTRPQFEAVWQFSEGVACIRVNNLHGFVAEDGKLIVKPRFVYADNAFQEGLAGVVEVISGPIRRPYPGGDPEIVYVPTKRGFIDKTGRYVIEGQWAVCSWFSEGLAAAKTENGKWGFIDRKGTWAINPRFGGAFSFEQGLALVELDGKYGFVGRNGDMAFEPQLEWAGNMSEDMPIQWGKEDRSLLGIYFCEGLSRVRVRGKWGFVSTRGVTVIPSRFDWAGFFWEGLALVKSQGKYGYVDKTGVVVIPPRFDDAGVFRDGLARVLIAGKWGFVDKRGTTVIPAQFDGAMDFRHGLGRVQVAGKWGYVRTDGNWVWRPTR